MLLRSGKVAGQGRQSQTTDRQSALTNPAKRRRADTRLTDTTAHNHSARPAVPSTTFLSLPLEIIKTITYFLSPPDAHSLSDVCKSLSDAFNGTAERGDLGAFWKVYLNSHRDDRIEQRTSPRAHLLAIVRRTCTSTDHKQGSSSWEVRRNRCPDGSLRCICSKCHEEAFDKFEEAGRVNEGRNHNDYVNDTAEFRRSVLKRALALEHLELRSDSNLCDAYIYDDEDRRMLGQIVRVMLDMHIIYEHSCMTDIIDHIRTTRSSSGESFHDRKETGEIYARRAYFSALEKYPIQEICRCGRPLLGQGPRREWQKIQPYEETWESWREEQQARIDDQSHWNHWNHWPSDDYDDSDRSHVDTEEDDNDENSEQEGEDRSQQDSGDETETGNQQRDAEADVDDDEAADKSDNEEFEEDEIAEIGGAKGDKLDNTHDQKTNEHDAREKIDEDDADSDAA